MSAPHASVLLNEILNAFADRPIRYFLDGTLGAGGHAEAILSSHPEIELYIGIDQDPEALEIARQRLSPWHDKLRLNHGNFSALESYLHKAGLSEVDGILLDLGVSSMQLDRPEKGFSFMRDGPLDMRMNPQNLLTAATIVNTWPASELGRIFREYGEEKKWRAAAHAIVVAREEKLFETTQDLVDVLDPVLRSYKNKKGLHPLTLVFQALRICVNSELEVLETVLPQAIQLLASKGRMAIISFHSLEDRIVKNALRFAAMDKYDTDGLDGVFLDKDPLVTILTRKPIIATEEEIQMNPRSRSAKLRVIEKI